LSKVSIASVVIRNYCRVGLHCQPNCFSIGSWFYQPLFHICHSGFFHASIIGGTGPIPFDNPPSFGFDADPGLMMSETHPAISQMQIALPHHCGDGVVCQSLISTKAHRVRGRSIAPDKSTRTRCCQSLSVSQSLRLSLSVVYLSASAASCHCCKSLPVLTPIRSAAGSDLRASLSVLLSNPTVHKRFWRSFAKEAGG
jgi:hypothetical protein